MNPDTPSPQEVEHRGIRWRRARPGATAEFLDPNTDRWVRWGPSVDAPPLPPEWGPDSNRGPADSAPGGQSSAGRPTRPGWRTPWRIAPLAVTVLVVVIAVVQVLRPSASNVTKETAATAALLGKCLAQHGTAEGHPRYSGTPVPCGSASATVKVAAVVPSRPGGTPCPSATIGYEVPYAGVEYPHILCLLNLR